ncbi:hypothetical protein JM81_1853 [Maribacter sp. MAR_2009_72]|nr:hypothetical protein JM81_1853 [Maribacter sp. MAR_2009_72]
MVLFSCLVKLQLTPELSVVRRQGNFSFPSAHEAKAYCLDLFFLSKAKSIRFSDFINIHRPFGLALQSALRLGIVTCRIFSVLF